MIAHKHVHRNPNYLWNEWSYYDCVEWELSSVKLEAYSRESNLAKCKALLGEDSFTWKRKYLSVIEVISG